jgi:hypothetical protein
MVQHSRAEAGAEGSGRKRRILTVSLKESRTFGDSRSFRILNRVSDGGLTDIDPNRELGTGFRGFYSVLAVPAGKIQKRRGRVTGNPRKPFLRVIGNHGCRLIKAVIRRRSVPLVDMVVPILVMKLRLLSFPWLELTNP